VHDCAPTSKLQPRAITRIRVAHASAPLQWLRVERRRSTRACHARTPPRASGNRFMSYERALDQRNASLPRCKTVLRRASCGLLRAAGIRVAHVNAPLHWLSVRRSCSTRTYDAHPPRPAGYGRSMPYETALHQRQISYPRLKSLFQHASCGLEQAAGFNVAHASAPLRHCSGFLWGGGAARALAKQARHAALVVIGPCHTKGN